jgi:cyclohexyl-isocyanide hydratase
MHPQPPTRLLIGGMIFPGIDQADFTGPFEVLSRLPKSEFLVIGRDTHPIRDVMGLILTPQIARDATPPLDVLLVPGGPGVNELMEDEETLEFLRRQSAGARLVLSVCTGALLLGAAGLLQGRRATTHWASHHLLPLFGAIPQETRVVTDGNLVTTAGVTSGLDGALRAAAILCGEATAQEIQLGMEYAPDPPFASGSPDTAPPTVRSAVDEANREMVKIRTEISRRVAIRLGQETNPSLS